MLTRRRLLFEINEENNRNFLKSDVPRTPHRTPRSSRNSRDMVRQGSAADAIVLPPASTNYVTPAGGHVSPRTRAATRVRTIYSL